MTKSGLLSLRPWLLFDKSEFCGLDIISLLFVSSFFAKGTANDLQHGQWIQYESSTGKFSPTPYARGLRKRDLEETLESMSTDLVIR